MSTRIYGPMLTETPRGNRYLLAVIDDYFRLTIVKLLKSKIKVAGDVIFGCGIWIKIYSLIRKQRRKKWNNRDKDGVLLGYDEL